MLQQHRDLPDGLREADRTLPRSNLIMGIDLGTTFSCVAIVEDDFPKVISTKKGLRTTPSIVAVNDNGLLLIGDEARKQLLINPTNTVYGSKRLIGRNFYSEEVSMIAKYFSYQVVPLGNMQVGAKIGDRVFSLPQVAAMILNELRQNVCDYLKENVYQAVISVPAYYNENQREAVREAGMIAGLEVVRIINEPTAAALAYGLNRKLEKKILVYDLGGGTFDASVLELYQDVFKVLATGGDTFLGGVDFDERVVEFILAEYERTENEILQCDSVITQRLKDAAERAKIELSAKSVSQIDLPYITISKQKFKDFRCELRRDQLNQLTADLVDRTIHVCIEVLNAAGLRSSEIDLVILVGGQTRMPLVVEKVTSFFGRPPTKGVHPDEVVACGSALMANSLGTDKNVRLLDVLPTSIGARQPNGTMKMIFPSNSPLPAEQDIGIATTTDYQEEIEIHLFQGNSVQADENEFLGAFIISGFPKAKKRKAKVLVKLSLNQESILDVSARCLSTGSSLTVRMTTSFPSQMSSGNLTDSSSPKNEKISGLRSFIQRLRRK